MATKTKKAAAVEQEAPRERRCSFRAVEVAKKKSGSGKLAVEFRLPGSTIWTLSITGLEEQDVESQLRRLESQGCRIEYNEFFQPVKKRR